MDFNFLRRISQHHQKMSVHQKYVITYLIQYGILLSVPFSPIWKAHDILKILRLSFPSVNKERSSLCVSSGVEGSFLCNFPPASDPASSSGEKKIPSGLSIMFLKKLHHMGSFRWSYWGFHSRFDYYFHPHENLKILVKNIFDGLDGTLMHSSFCIGCHCMRTIHDSSCLSLMKFLSMKKGGLYRKKSLSHSSDHSNIFPGPVCTLPL